MQRLCDSAHKLARRQLDRLLAGQRLARAGQADDGCPYYRLVPKQFHANLLFRRQLLIRCHADPQFAEQIREMCRQDLLFYVNAFVWLYEPRSRGREPRRIPFITWEYQDEALLAIRDAIGEHDLVVPKSRDMGVTWIVLTVFDWVWKFQPMSMLGTVSRVENYVDGDDNSLFKKIDRIHEMQPAWLLPRTRIRGGKDPFRKKNKILNSDNGSSIVGESTTGDIFRAGRLLACFIDEHASFPIDDGFRAEEATRDVTNSRIYVSTPKPGETAFKAKLRTDCPRLKLHWTRHPIKVKGLYERTVAGKAQLKDVPYWRRFIERKSPGLPIPERADELRDLIEHEELYHFVTDEPRLPIRSPWLDRECRRALSQREILQEVDMQEDVGDNPFYNAEVLRQHAATYARPPMVLANILHGLRGEFPELEMHQDGRLRLWRPLAAGKPPITHGYAIGIDVASGTSNAFGTHASESAAAIFDVEQAEMVGMWACPGILPEQLAPIMYALGYLFTGPDGPALLNWEALGPGLMFGKVLVEELAYPNVCWRTDISTANSRFKPIPGFHADKRGKKIMHSYLRKGLDPHGEYGIVIHAEDVLEELGQFVDTVNDEVEHRAALQAEQGVKASRTGHGDKGTAAALGWFAARPLAVKHKYNAPKPMPRVCAQRYIEEHERRRRETDARRLYVL